MIEILSLYYPITSQDKHFFSSKTEIKSYKRGEYLLVDEDVQEKLFLVKKGTTMLYYDNEGKKEVIDFAYQNRFSVDINSFSNQTPSKYNIKCIEDCEIEAISYCDLNDFFDLSPDTERAYRILLETILSATVRRLLNQHILTIQQRFDNLVASRPELFKIVAHKHLASYLNINPTNFSKLFNQCANREVQF